MTHPQGTGPQDTGSPGTDPQCTGRGSKPR